MEFRTEKRLYEINRSKTKGRNGLHRYNVIERLIRGHKLSTARYFYVHAKNLKDAFKRMEKGEGIEK